MNQPIYKWGIFSIALLGTVFLEWYDPHSVLIFFFKPLILLSLVYQYGRRKTLTWSFNRWVMLGLIASLFGDEILELTWHSNAFIIGLCCFLLAHLAYFSAFQFNEKGSLKFSFHWKSNWLITALYVLFGSYFIFLLAPHLGEMKIPVFGYFMVISLMTLSAVTRSAKTNRKSLVYGIIGALLFVGSDSLLAYDRFIAPIEHSGAFIMISYGIAQAMLFISFSAHNDLHDSVLIKSKIPS